MASRLSHRRALKISVASHYVPKHEIPPSGFYDEAKKTDRLLYTLDDFKPSTVCRTLWSFAQLGIKPEGGLIERLMSRTMYYPTP